MRRAGAVLDLGVGDGLEHVGFAGELEAVAQASVGVEDVGAGRSEFTAAFHAFCEESQFGELVIAAVQPDIQTRRSGGCFVGNDDAVGLDGAVDAGAESAHDESLGPRPGSIAGFQRLEAGASFLQQLSGGGGLLEVVKFAPLQGSENRDGKDFDVGEPGAKVGGEHSGV